MNQDNENIKRIRELKLEKQMQLARIQQSINKQLSEVKDIFRDLEFNNSKMPKFDFSFTAGFSEKLSLISDRIVELNKTTPEDLKLIASYGWYIDMDASIYYPEQYAALIRKGEILELEAKFLKYYQEESKRIFKELKNRHKTRADIFSQIESSIGRKEFNISIPTLLLTRRQYIEIIYYL